MSKVVDLDALVPLAAKIKVDGVEIEIPPPKTGQLLMMGRLWRETRDDDISQVELDQRVDVLVAHLQQMVPALAGKDLAFTQIVALIEILDDMALPPEVKEAGEKGIAVDDPKKAS